MYPAALLSSLLLAIGLVHAGPIGHAAGSATVKIRSRVSTGGFTNIVEQDRARIQALRQSHLSGRDSAIISTSVSNAIFYNTAEVGVGVPPTYYTLLVDTGSANTWVGGNNKTYVPTRSSVNTGNHVSRSYGSGGFSGQEYIDTVTLAPNLVIQQQSIGVASSSQGPNAYDGILGVGPTDLTQGSVSNTYEVPTVMDSLYAQESIPQEVLGIFYPPTTEPDSCGTLTFGGIDGSVITSPVEYVPLTTNPSASPWWGINQSISYGESVIMPNTAGIVDTGTTLTLIPSTAFQKYQSMTGAILDPVTNLLSITPAQYANLQPLTFQIGSSSFSLPPNGQIWPRALNEAAGGNSSAIYLIFGDLQDAPGGPPFSFCNGYTFLQRFYSVFDTTNHCFGIAETIYTNSNAN